MAYHYVEPEVAGELGPGTVIDTTVHPPRVSRLEYRFSDWLGDGLVESFPCFIVTGAAARAMQRAGLTGATFDTVHVTVTADAAHLLDRLPARWARLAVTSPARQADMGLSRDHRLVVSDHALAVLRRHGLDHAEIGPYSTQ